jgi:two-component system, OmpR family, sensor histidine kinase QseC
MRSIRARLFVILIGATAFVWLSAVAWIHAATRAEVERVLDARLAEAARMVGSLVADQRIALGEGGPPILVPAADAGDAEAGAYRRQLSCQIWSLDGDLVGRSAAAPDAPLGTHDEGFTTTQIGHELWRVYAVVDPALGIRVVVGDTLAVRAGLVNDVVAGLLLPALVILPVLAGLIWVGVGHGLRPMRALAQHLAGRPADDLRPVPPMDVATEIRPVIGALDGLFARVERARRRERDFTAFAAHELKTPLAGIQTQAQIARAADDTETAEAALGRIEAGIARTDRMVRQLLDMAAADADDLAAGDTVAVRILVEAAAAEIRPVLEARAVSLEIEEAEPSTAPRLLQLALRNVLENAAQASPPGGTIHCRVDGGGVTVCDTGRGVEEADLARIAEPFYRGRNTGCPGSGLGLAIVARVMARSRGALCCVNRPEGGLAVRLDLHAAPNASA